MTYIVSSGTLNPTIPYLRAPQYVNPALIMEYDVPAPLLRLTDVSTMLGRLEDKTEEYQ